MSADYRFQSVVSINIYSTIYCSVLYIEVNLSAAHHAETEKNVVECSTASSTDRGLRRTLRPLNSSSSSQQIKWNSQKQSKGKFPVKSIILRASYLMHSPWRKYGTHEDVNSSRSRHRPCQQDLTRRQLQLPPVGDECVDAFDAEAMPACPQAIESKNK